MKLIYYLLLVAIGWIFIPDVSAQDLIERAQKDIVMDFSRSTASIAHLESQSLKHAGAYQVVDPFVIASESRSAYVDYYVSDQVLLDLPKGTITRLMSSMKDGIDLRIPVSTSRSIELDLVEVFPVSSEFEGRTSEGVTFTIVDYPVRFYRGAVKGIPNSFASITIADGMFRGLIGDDFGNYVLAELDGSDDHFILYNDQKLKIEQDFECGVDAMPYSDSHQNLLRKTERVVDNSRGDDCVNIMVEMEEDFYDDWNNFTQATNFIYSLINEVATIYNNENISIALKDVIMWTISDPYTATGLCSATNDLLDEFADERQNNYNGRLAHLITSRSVGGGCAFVDVLCHNYTNSSTKSQHAVSGNMSTSVTSFPTYSWNVMVFAHEMGHNFGSSHTHACVWNGNSTAIDGCGTTNGCADPGNPIGGGTVMSYCHLTAVGINLSLGFGTQPGNLIRAEVAVGTCTLDCGSSVACPRYIYLDGNVDADTYYADVKIEMGGTVLSGRTINLRSEGTIEWNSGFRVNNGGVLTADYSTCTAALTGQTDDGSQSTPVDKDLKDKQEEITLNK